MLTIRNLTVVRIFDIMSGKFNVQDI